MAFMIYAHHLGIHAMSVPFKAAQTGSSIAGYPICPRLFKDANASNAMAWLDICVVSVFALIGVGQEKYSHGWHGCREGTYIYIYIALQSNAMAGMGGHTAPVYPRACRASWCNILLAPQALAMSKITNYHDALATFFGKAALVLWRRCVSKKRFRAEASLLYKDISDWAEKGAQLYKL